MGNFGRVLRLALRYRFTLLASVLCARGAALLWGGDIGAIFPFLQVSFRGQSLQEAMADDIQQSEARATELGELLGRLEQQRPQTPPEQQAALQARIGGVQQQIEAETKHVATCRAWQPYLERYLPHDPFSTLGLIVVALLVGTVLKDLFLISNSILVSRLGELTAFDLRKRFYRRTLRMDLATFTNDGTSELLSRFTNDMQAVSNGLVALFGKLVREPLKAIACLAGAAFICWRLLLLSLVITPPAMLAVRWLARMLKRANRKALEEMAADLQHARRDVPRNQDRQGVYDGAAGAAALSPQRQAVLPQVDEDRPLRLAQPPDHRGDGDSHDLPVAVGRRVARAPRPDAPLRHPHERPPLEPRGVDALLRTAGRGGRPGAKLSEVLTRIQQAAAASDRVFALLDRQPQVKDPARPVRLPRHHGNLVFEKVCFGYQPDQPILQDINLEISFGERIAVVGPNGCGKTTLVNLIPRFADPTSGVLRLDGVGLPEVRLRELRRQIGLVTQETLLFDDTVFNNIRYGSPRASRQQVMAAARQAHAHEFIAGQLPEGYDTVVGQSGSRLSGGQRQRIALARAILRDPAIIILDEATSQVDLESEQLIQNVLEQFVRNRTAIIITHRLALLALATRIVVMDSGRILDVGAHEALVTRCPLYARLYQIQADRLGGAATAEPNVVPLPAPAICDPPAGPVPSSGPAAMGALKKSA